MLILTFGTIFYVNNNINKNDKYNNYEKTIAALNDTITHTKIKGYDLYSKPAPAMNINDLVNSEYFKTLSANQQQFYNELTKVKGLLSSTQAQLEKQGELLGSINVTKNDGSVDDDGDSISFKRNTNLSFAETDSTKKLQWKATVNIDKQTTFKLDYDYNFDIQTNFVYQKNKSVVVTYKLNDPDLKVNKMMNFTIPENKPKTKFGQWVQRNKVTLGSIGAGLLFTGGTYVGYGIGSGHFIGFK